MGSSKESRVTRGTEPGVGATPEKIGSVPTGTGRTPSRTRFRTSSEREGVPHFRAQGVTVGPTNVGSWTVDSLERGWGDRGSDRDEVDTTRGRSRDSHFPFEGEVPETSTTRTMDLVILGREWSEKVYGGGDPPEGPRGTTPNSRRGKRKRPRTGRRDNRGTSTTTMSQREDRGKNRTLTEVHRTGSDTGVPDRDADHTRTLNPFLTYRPEPLVHPLRRFRPGPPTEVRDKL